MTELTVPTSTDSDGVIAFDIAAAKCAFNAALAIAQGMFEPIVKNRDVSIQMKAGGSYRFRYADLEEVLTKTRSGLSKNGLSIRSAVTTNESGVWLHAVLAHAAGHEDVSSMKLDGGGDIKVFGANITYLRRYMVTAMLGVAADDDADENGQAGGEGGNVAAPGVGKNGPKRRGPAASTQAMQGQASAGQVGDFDRDPSADRDRFPPDDGDDAGSAPALAARPAAAPAGVKMATEPQIKWINERVAAAELTESDVRIMMGKCSMASMTSMSAEAWSAGKTYLLAL